LSNEKELLFIEFTTNWIIRFYCLSPRQKILESGDLEAEDKSGNVGLIVSQESKIFFKLMLSPLLIDCFLELLDDFELCNEVLLQVRVNEPFA